MTRPRKLDDADKEKILTRVRRGDYLTLIARETGFNTAIIRATAQRAGLVIQRMTDAQVEANARKGRKSAARKVQAVHLAPVMSLRDHYTGMKRSLRW